MVKKFTNGAWFQTAWPMLMHFDNQSGIYVAQFIPSLKQLADLLTKTASPQVYSNLCNKLGMLDVYAPA